MTAAATRPVAIKIDTEMKERVKRLADARHRTPHWLMREAITQYVEREEKREAFRQDAIKAWEEYQVTGPARDGRGGGCLAGQARRRSRC